MCSFSTTPRTVATGGHFTGVPEDQSATERLLFAARRESTEALRIHLQHAQLANASPKAHCAVPPTPEDLFALYALHGGNEAAVIQTLAKLWRCAPSSIAPAVLAWLDQLPAYIPPSRTRSSPSVFLPHELLKSHDRAAVAMPQIGISLKQGVLRYADHRAAPAVSAPVGPSSASFASALSGLHSASSRLHADASHASSSSPHRSGGGGGGGAPDFVLSLPRQPTFVPVLLTAAEVDALPEHATAGDNETNRSRQSHQQEALEAFMTHEALKGRIEPSAEMRYDISHSMRF